jgi:hypothetical protein
MTTLLRAGSISMLCPSNREALLERIGFTTMAVVYNASHPAGATKQCIAICNRPLLEKWIRTHCDSTTVAHFVESDRHRFDVVPWSDPASAEQYRLLRCKEDVYAFEVAPPLPAPLVSALDFMAAHTRLEDITRNSSVDPNLKLQLQHLLLQLWSAKCYFLHQLSPTVNLMTNCIIIYHHLARSTDDDDGVGWLGAPIHTRAPLEEAVKEQHDAGASVCALL